MRELGAIIPERPWPEVEFKEKRAITLAEQPWIVRSDRNPERLAFYEPACHVGAAEPDLAVLGAAGID